MQLAVGLSLESVRYRLLSEIWVTLGASTAEVVSRTKKNPFGVGTALVLPVIDGRLS